jgi:ribonuclease HI
MADRLDDFQKFRAELNEEILACGHLGMKRFFALDHQAYEPGPLGTRTKELLGLVASAVLRCDDCVTYHLVRCGEEGWKREEVIDALNVAMIVGGSITIPTFAARLRACTKSPASNCKVRMLGGVS